MSNQQSRSSYVSYSSTSYTSSSSQSGGQPHTQSYSETAHYDSRQGGGQFTRESRETGQPTLTETRDIDSQGRLGGLSSGNNRIESGGAVNSGRRIEDVTDAEQAERDRLYEERMEEEYAKREGGA